MKENDGWKAGVVIIVIAAAAFGVMSSFHLSAQPNPGRLETLIANSARNWYLRRAVGPLPPARLPQGARTLARGAGMYAHECAFCHGQQADGPTPIGLALYPRAVNLRAPGVERLSNRELLWVITNGIRLTGMPGFGQTNNPREIADIAAYLRSLPPATPQPEPGPSVAGIAPRA